MHYLNFKGPSRPNNDVIPIYLKRPRKDPATTYAPKQRRLLQRSTTTREAVNLKTRAIDDSLAEQDSQQCTEGQGDSLAEQQYSHHAEQDDSTVEAYERPESQAALTAAVHRYYEQYEGSTRRKSKVAFEDFKA